jgi:tetratricopeptide (TPR) repeat protein
MDASLVQGRLGNCAAIVAVRPAAERVVTRPVATRPVATRPKVPNRILRCLLAEAGWTEDFLARQVNAVAAESGLVLRLDRRSVTHWLAGRLPRSPVPELIAEALSRGLRRSVGVADLGLGAPVASPSEPVPDLGGPVAGLAGREGSALPRDVGSVLTGLAQYDEGPRRILPTTAYRLAALAVPGWTQAAARLCPIPEAASGLAPWPDASCAQRLQPGQVATAEQMVRVFSDNDDSFGGGRAREELSCYLAFDIVPRLRAAGPPALRRRFFSAATQLVYLAAFMCFDDERHGLAQRYYLAALELATENSDPVGYAVSVRGLSVQARALGHHRHAVQLAETAARISRSTTGPARQAFLLGQVAVAAAAAGDRRHALTTISAAERRLDQACSPATASPATADPARGDPSTGRYHPAALAHQQATVRALLGDKRGAITALTEAVRYRPPWERRSRALIHARLAELHLEQGHLDQAVATWHAFLDDYSFLTCGRATTALKVLRSRLQPRGTNPAVRQLLARTTTWTQARAAS